MPSLRKRVSTYLRQLSFHNEPREKRHNVNENAFVTKYLEGLITFHESPPIIYGKNPTDLPNYELGKYNTGPDTIVGCYSGPNGGLTTVKRTEKHLSIPDDDIDFIDHPSQEDPEPSVPSVVKKSPKRQPIDNTTMVIKVAGNEYRVTNKPKRHSKSHSLGSIGDFNLVEVEKTKIDKEIYCDTNREECECDKDCEGTTETKKQPESNTNRTNIVVNNNNNNINVKHRQKKVEEHCLSKVTHSGSNSLRNNLETKSKNYALSKSRSDGNPFQAKKRGKNIQVQRQLQGEDQSERPISDTELPDEWNRRSDSCFGLSDSLYDRNLITKQKNGDPIADCFGVVARNDSAILAVADGVNWGEKASVAAKSAIHASLHYLNKTIFNDTKPFERLTNKTDCSNDDTLTPQNLIGNTREVFVCLLRAFNCAHDLILENKGMLTTLTVAIVLPLKKRANQESRYVCCVCNVGDTLAYVYSQENGIRELTKGSHDVNSNRDMRDALGALGPVDGINPELSNLTLSLTTLNKGDIVLVASDGLTDNFDPNVCRFTVNSKIDPTNKVKKESSRPVQQESASQILSIPIDIGQPPVKPPRRSKNPGNSREKPISESASSINDPPEGKPFDESKMMKKPLGVAENKASSLRKQALAQNRLGNRKSTPPKASHQTMEMKTPETNYKFSKSKTSLDLRPHQKKVQIPRNEDGIPYVTPIQRYELQLLLMEDILKNGISGRDGPVKTSKKLCENLVNFTVSITSAKRRTLEDQDMYFDNRNGVLVEASNHEKKLRRKKGLEKVQSLPGKLDHVTVVAYNVGLL